MPFQRNYTVPYILVFAGTAFAASFVLKTYAMPRRATPATPASYSATASVDRPTLLEGDVGVARVQLVNHLDKELTIASVATSCGCMALDRAADQIDRVQPKGVWSLVVKVDSTFRAGKQTYQLLIDIVQDGRHEQRSVPFEFSVVPGWRTIPSSLESHELTSGERRSMRMEIVDAFPGAGIELDHLEWSGPGVRGARWSPIPPNQTEKTFKDENGYQFRVRGHIQVEVEASSQLEVSHGSITAVPKDSARPRLEVPITLQLRSRPVTSIPETLVFGSKTGNGQFNKRFYLKRSDQEKRSLRIVSPPGITVQPLPSTDSNLDSYEVVVDVDQIDAKAELALVVMSGDSGEELLRVPMKILGEMQENARH